MNQISDIFLGLNTLQRTLIVLIGAIIIYIFSTAFSYSLFSSSSIIHTSNKENKTEVLSSSGGIQEEEPGIPKTESCPLNGSMHTAKAKETWEKRRPLAVMIENHIEARPQSGLTSADVVYEAVAEGGITRFMALFYCNTAEVQVGPVRSARTYFLDWLSEYDGLYAHVGGANCDGQGGPGCGNGAPADALGQIIAYKIKDLNQSSIGFPNYWRDYVRLGHPVATEHTMYSTTTKLWEVGEKRGWTVTDSSGIRWDKSFVPWKFKDDPASGSVNDIKVAFWSGRDDYNVEWNFDKNCNCYKRKNGGVDHLDLDNNRQLSPINVVVQFMQESRANDGYENNVHLLYANKGEGKALIFEAGKVTVGKWQKPSRLAREKFVDEKEKEIEFNKGQIWIETVPEGSTVTY